MKKIILILSAFIINLFIINNANAENFVINSYKIDMNVTQNRTAEISENINVYFTKESHGIFRSIPIRNTITRNDGTKNIEYSRISDIKTSHRCSKSFAKNNLILKLGDPNYYANPNTTYKINYKYYMGNDNVKNADELYFNIIGTEWNTTISKVYFSITLPKEFDANKVGFSMGSSGSVGYNPEKLKYKVYGTTIMGYTTTYLKPGEGITIRIELPDNYFDKTLGINNLVLFLAILLTVIPVVLWAIFGKDDPVVPIVNFNAPENRNSAEVEVEYSGKSTNKGITSLVFYLASKGYLEIEYDNIDYTIKKLKPYDGNKSSERALMDALFVNGSDRTSQTQIQTSSLFYTYSTKIQRSLNKIRGFIFNKESCSPEKIAIIGISIVGLCLLLIYTLGDYSFRLLHSDISFLFLFPIIAISVLILMISSKDLGQIIFGIIWGSGFGGIPMMIILSQSQFSLDNLPIIFILFAGIIVSIICLINMPKRNYQGRMVLGQILGLKKYLEVVEKPRLIAQIKENPNVVSEILPFAYVLDVADNLIDCIEENIEYQPTWYHGKFNKRSFYNISNRISSAAIPPRSSSSHHGRSHGFSGGGHSGGGHGGGGGGSW